MKNILISIKPRFVAKILNGEKTIEVRKSKPNIELPIDVYIYCTKDRSDFLVNADLIRPPFPHPRKYMLGHKDYSLNGKVVAKFTLNKVEEIKFTEYEWYGTKETPSLQVLDKSCLSPEEITTYLKNKNKDKDGIGCAIHINDLETFDRPRELSEFRIYCDREFHSCLKPCRNCPHQVEDDERYGTCDTRLTKAPQSFCYVEIGE